MKKQFLGAIALALSLVVSHHAVAQVAPLVEIEIGLDVESGPVDNETAERGVIYATAIQIPDAAWIRLMFDSTTLLARAPVGAEPTIVRITAVRDGASQTLNARHLRQWGYTSAYFNGGVLLVEVIADPGVAGSRLTISRARVGPLTPTSQQTICGPTDDRLPSEDRRVGRLEPIGCTAWIIDDPGHCLLTAGHCTGGGSQVMEFNVPLSDANGNRQHPGPEDQFAIDQSSMQSNGGQGTGDDWAYFGCFPNTETGLTPFQGQGEFFVLSDVPPAAGGQEIRITGYGTTGSGVPREWNQAQKTHTGPYVSFTGTRIQYATDTTGGNSGSPVIDEETGEAIGIHAHGGCNQGGGQNNGTGSNHPDLRDAMANPLGVCALTGTPGDVDGDGDVDFDDVLALLEAWGDCDEPPAECPADLDADGEVTFNDLLLLIANWTG